MSNNSQALPPPPPPDDQYYGGGGDDYYPNKQTDDRHRDDLYSDAYSGAGATIPAHQSVQNLQFQPRVAANGGGALVFPQQGQQQLLVLQQPGIQQTVGQVQAQQHVQMIPVQRQVQQIQMVPVQRMRMVQVQQPVQRQVKIKSYWIEYYEA
jgi:hypothetical protein